MWNALPADAEARARSEARRQLLELFDPEVEMIGYQVTMGTFRGRREFNAAWGEWLDTWQSHRSEIEEIHAQGEKVLVFTRDHFVTPEGLAMDSSLAQLHHVRGGRVTRMQIFREKDREAAWAAFGSESNASRA